MTELDPQQSEPPNGGTATTQTDAADETNRPPEQLSYYDRIDVTPPLEDDPRYLIFVATKGAPPPPDELISLRDGFSQVARIVRILFNDDVHIRRELFTTLHVAADRALRGPEFSLVDGSSNLTAMREIVADHALKIRSDRFKEYNKLLVLSGVLPCVLAFALTKFSSCLSVLNWDVVRFATMSLFLIAGATICVWAEFVLRVHEDLDFDQLLKLDLGRWQPRQRVIITIVVSFIFAFLLNYNVVQVGLGGLLLNDFAKTPELALAIGGVTGFAFPAVRDIMYRLKPEERR